MGKIQTAADRFYSQAPQEKLARKGAHFFGVYSIVVSSFVSSQEYRVGAPALTKCKALAVKWKHVFLKM